ncbi:MAG: tryptophan--tRNA ligase [bacterium]|nr:tryptophan--tRNA ligase [bacterium]
MLEIQKEQFDQEIEATIDNYFASNATVGLFDYPVLMAADILLYDTDEVPVGDDQKQHVEIARDIAKRVNNKFGKVFTVPEPIIKKEGARIMSLVDPTKKMAKSDDSENSYVLLRDNADTIYKKFARATTDSENVIKFDKEKKPGISNLLNIMSVATETPIPELEKKYADSNYGEFKKDVADCVIELLKPLQEKLAEYDKNEDYVRKVLKDGAEAVAPRAQATLERVKKAVGLGL